MSDKSLYIFGRCRLVGSEDDDVAMDEDGAAPQKATKPKGDLSEYNLDNYDEEEDGAGTLSS